MKLMSNGMHRNPEENISLVRREIIMIIGIGMDLCSIDRFSSMMGKESFLKRFFSESEREYIAEKGASIDNSIAGIYAAKEAFVKAIGTGIINVDLTAIEIIHTLQGQPQYNLSGWAADEVKKRGITSFYLSITHDSGMAGAVAVAEVNN